MYKYCDIYKQGGKKIVMKFVTDNKAMVITFI